MQGLNPRRTDATAHGTESGRVNADQHRYSPENGSSRIRLAGSSSDRAGPGPLDYALLSLAVTEKRLLGLLHDNESLRIENRQLMLSLADAARRAVAAQRIAHHDQLTGLPNRVLLIKRLQLALKNAADGQFKLALMFIDLDGFKSVNDRFGHAVADRLLTAVAARIAACVRGDDLACRYGGDEFVVLLSNLADAKIAAGVAETIRDHLGGRYFVDGNEVHITASVGLAVYPADGERYDTLLSRADASMYRDKANRCAQGASRETRAIARTGYRKKAAEIVDAC